VPDLALSEGKESLDIRGQGCEQLGVLHMGALAVDLLLERGFHMELHGVGEDVIAVKACTDCRPADWAVG